MIHLLNILSIGSARDAGDVYSVIFIFIKNATALPAAIVRQESVYSFRHLGKDLYLDKQIAW